MLMENFTTNKNIDGKFYRLKNAIFLEIKIKILIIYRDNLLYFFFLKIRTIYLITHILIISIIICKLLSLSLYIDKNIFHVCLFENYQKKISTKRKHSHKRRKKNQK